MSVIVKTLTQHQVEKRHVHKFPDNIFVWKYIILEVSSLLISA